MLPAQIRRACIKDGKIPAFLADDKKASRNPSFFVTLSRDHFLLCCPPLTTNLRQRHRSSPSHTLHSVLPTRCSLLATNRWSCVITQRRFIWQRLKIFKCRLVQSPPPLSPFPQESGLGIYIHAIECAERCCLLFYAPSPVYVRPLDIVLSSTKNKHLQEARPKKKKIQRRQKTDLA